MAKRSIAIAGHRTSISLEEPFWAALAEIAEARALSLSGLVAEIDRERPPRTNLSSAVRMFVLAWFREPAPAGPDRR
ncbi:MAG: ribbon-helix-helix domain-containing protein [Bauldia sp.]